MKPIHIALDFDRTLATYKSKQEFAIGEPIFPMIDRVKEWVQLGYEITIFTARVSDRFKNGKVRDSRFKYEQKQLIQDFLEKHGLPRFGVTANKSPHFSHFVDDKAVGVQENQGKIITHIENL